MSSPCTGTCCLDENKCICKCCKRTVQEIQEWRHMDLKQRKAVLKRIKKLEKNNGG